MAAEVNNSYDQHVWYTDSGANAHITTNAGNLTKQQSYKGDDTLQVGNGSDLVVKQAWNSTLSFDHSSFKPTNVLYYPNTSAIFLSINQLFWIMIVILYQLILIFCVKENKMGRILLQGPIKNELYPFTGHKSFSNKPCCLTAMLWIKTSLGHWHNCLVHPAKPIFDPLRNYLSIFYPSRQISFRSSCQLGKATELPFADSVDNL